MSITRHNCTAVQTLHRAVHVLALVIVHAAFDKPPEPPHPNILSEDLLDHEQ